MLWAKHIHVGYNYLHFAKITMHGDLAWNSVEYIHSTILGDYLLVDATSRDGHTYQV